MRSKGKIKVWKDDNGYGFIQPMTGGPQVFVHIKAFANRHRRPEPGDVVSYDLTRDGRGRPRAERASFAGEKLTLKRARKRGGAALIFVALFFAAVCASVVMTGLPLLVPVVYALMSLVTFAIYAKDKYAARKGRWRTPEASLHMLALMGGWPGALVAQGKLRHKSKKTSFRFTFWITVLINSGLLFWIHTVDGREVLEQLVGEGSVWLDEIIAYLKANVEMLEW